MKKWKAFLLAVVMLVCFTACGNDAENNGAAKNSAQTSSQTETNAQSSQASTEEAGNSQEEPTVVRMSIGSEPDSLDPWQSAASDTDAIFRNVFEGLMSFNEKGEIIPGLAESYEVSEDG